MSQEVYILSKYIKTYFILYIKIYDGSKIVVKIFMDLYILRMPESKSGLWNYACLLFVMCSTAQTLGAILIIFEHLIKYLGTFFQQKIWK